jgi:hypothetical protein
VGSGVGDRDPTPESTRPLATDDKEGTVTLPVVALTSTSHQNRDNLVHCGSDADRSSAA